MFWKELSNLNVILKALFTDRHTLIELYRITLEQLRHQEWIYIQAILGTAILIPAFLIAIGFLFGSDSPVHSQYVPWIKGIIFGLSILLVFFLIPLLLILLMR